MTDKDPLKKKKNYNGMVYQHWDDLAITDLFYGLDESASSCFVFSGIQQTDIQQTWPWLGQSQPFI